MATSIMNYKLSSNRTKVFVSTSVDEIFGRSADFKSSSCLMPLDAIVLLRRANSEFESVRLPIRLVERSIDVEGDQAKVAAFLRI